MCSSSSGTISFPTWSRRYRATPRTNAARWTRSSRRATRRCRRKGRRSRRPPRTCSRARCGNCSRSRNPIPTSRPAPISSNCRPSFPIWRTRSRHHGASSTMRCRNTIPASSASRPLCSLAPSVSRRRTISISAMAAYGLYSHIQSNRRRSIALLVGLFFLIYLMVYAGALAAEALSVNADTDVLMRLAWNDFLYAAPWATIGTALWVVIAYYFHQGMIDALTGGREVTRAEEPRLYNILENLCISRGITMPRLKVMESDALNAFATGMSPKQYSITVTTGLIKRLNDAEIEAVLGHELTHIRNGDVRMMVIAVIIAGVVSFFAELVFRLWFYNGFSFRGRSDDRRGGGAAFAILIAVAII